jgi:sphingosine kinase
MAPAMRRARHVMDHKLLPDDKAALDYHLNPAFDGCSPFLTVYCGPCVLFLVVLPLWALLSDSVSSQDPFPSLFSMIATLALLFMGFCCFSLSPLWKHLVLDRPPLPDNLPPLVNPPMKEPRPVRTVAVIYNPFGGVGLAARVIREAEEVFSSRGVKVKKLQTERAGHGFDLARELDLDTVDAVVACGGDGSMHDVLNGLLARDDAVLGDGTPRCPVPFGVLPAGTGNCVVRSFGVGACPTPKHVASWICDGFVSNVDVSAVDIQHCPHIQQAKPSPAEGTDTAGATRVYSMHSICYGLGADVSAFSEYMRMLGAARYDIAVVWMILAANYVRAAFRLSSLESSGRSTEEKEVVTGFFNNAPFVGKGLYISPSAQFDSGTASTTRLMAGRRSETMATFLLLPEGRHTTLPLMDFGAETHAECIFPGKNACLSIDGEVYSLDESFSMSVVPGVVPLLVPKDANLPWSERVDVTTTT